MANKLQIERKAIVQIIAGMIKKTFDAGKNIDKEKLILVLMKDYMVARRTAMEYINHARIYVDWIEEKGVMRRSSSQTNLDIGIYFNESKKDGN